MKPLWTRAMIKSMPIQSQQLTAGANVLQMWKQVAACLHTTLNQNICIINTVYIQRWNITSTALTCISLLLYIINILVKAKPKRKRIVMDVSICFALWSWPVLSMFLEITLPLFHLQVYYYSAPDASMGHTVISVGQGLGVNYVFLVF